MALSRSSDLYLRLRQARNRIVIARKRLGSVDPTAYVHPTTSVAKDLVAGSYVFIGPHCKITPLVTIGRYTMLASDIAIVGNDHNWSEPGVPMQFAGRPTQRATTIGDDVWLGQGVIVMRGVTIGDAAIVAAGAVVTKNVPAYEVWAGVPAKKLRDRFEHPSHRDKHAAMLADALVHPAFAEDLGNYGQAFGAERK
jgi:acetyltransferase-like isoleucine patch superfamily enzyme